MKLLLVNNSHDRVPEKWLTRWVKALNRQIARRGHKTMGRRELVTVFVNSTEMRRLNRQYRGKNYATDVLSLGARR